MSHEWTKWSTGSVEASSSSSHVDVIRLRHYLTRDRCWCLRSNHRVIRLNLHFLWTSTIPMLSCVSPWSGRAVADVMPGPVYSSCPAEKDRKFQGSVFILFYCFKLVIYFGLFGLTWQSCHMMQRWEETSVRLPWFSFTQLYDSFNSELRLETSPSLLYSVLYRFWYNNVLFFLTCISSIGFIAFPVFEKMHPTLYFTSLLVKLAQCHHWSVVPPFIKVAFNKNSPASSKNTQKSLYPAEQFDQKADF